MWSFKIYRNLPSFLVLFFIIPNIIQAQDFKLNLQESSLKVFGTSSLHDWHVVAEKQNGAITFNNLERGEIRTCSIEVISESLKSGKTSMDKNTYKALKTDTNKIINFTLAEVKEVLKKGDNEFSIKSIGDLSVAGTKKRIPLNFDLDIKSGKIVISGEKTILMTQFNIEPPKALFGTITTGDEITIKFLTTFK